MTMYTENTLETNYLKLFELYPNTKDSLHQPVAGDGAGARAGHGGGVRGGGGGRVRALSLHPNTAIAVIAAAAVAAVVVAAVVVVVVVVVVVWLL